MVNLPDFSTKLFEDGALAFETRNVIGTPVDEQRTPEFSDVIEHIITNPTWNVPKSITLKEYLPEMQEDPLAHDYLELIDLDREIVPRSLVDFNEYDEDTFPYDLKQMPSITNALGLVKFNNFLRLNKNLIPLGGINSQNLNNFSHIKVGEKLHGT